MQAYATNVDDGVPAQLAEDAFGRSWAAFEALTATLGGTHAGTWTHDHLEEHLATEGREVLRLLLQDHLDLRAAREQHAVGPGRTVAIIDADGIDHRTVEPGTSAT